MNRYPPYAHRVVNRDADHRAARQRGAGHGGQRHRARLGQRQPHAAARLDTLHGGDQVGRRVDGHAVGGGHDVARFDACLVGREAVLDRDQLSAQPLDLHRLSQRPLGHHLGGLLGCGHRPHVLPHPLLIRLAGGQDVIVGDERRAVHQVLGPQLLDQVGLKHVDVHEVEAGAVGRLPLARDVHDLRGRMCRIGQEGIEAGLRLPAVGDATARQREAERQHDLPAWPVAPAVPRPPKLGHPPATWIDAATVAAPNAARARIVNGDRRP